MVLSSLDIHFIISPYHSEFRDDHRGEFENLYQIGASRTRVDYLKEKEESTYFMISRYRDVNREAEAARTLENKLELRQKRHNTLEVEAESNNRRNDSQDSNIPLPNYANMADEYKYSDMWKEDINRYEVNNNEYDYEDSRLLNNDNNTEDKMEVLKLLNAASLGVLNDAFLSIDGKKAQGIPLLKETSGNNIDSKKYVSGMLLDNNHNVQESSAILTKPPKVYDENSSENDKRILLGEDEDEAKLRGKLLQTEVTNAQNMYGAYGESGDERVHHLYGVNREQQEVPREILLDNNSNELLMLSGEVGKQISKKEDYRKGLELIAKDDKKTSFAEAATIVAVVSSRHATGGRYTDSEGMIRGKKLSLNDILDIREFDEHMKVSST